MRLEVTHRGKRYETFVEHLMGEIASMVRVPREEDFGIDYYCHPIVKIKPNMETIAEFCALQVKGGHSPLEYGGLAKNKRDWKGHHFDWLRSQGVPLYLAKVNAKLTRVELFSLWPIWMSFWCFGIPFKTVVKTLPPTFYEYNLERPTEGNMNELAKNFGNGRTCCVNVGPPFLALTTDKNISPELALEIFRKRIEIDQKCLTWFRLGIPFVHQISAWQTNIPDISIERKLIWNDTPGMNIEPLARAAEAVITALGVNLQWQNNPAASRLIPILQWLKDEGFLGGIGGGFLDGLLSGEKTLAKPSPDCEDDDY